MKLTKETLKQLIKEELDLAREGQLKPMNAQAILKDVVEFLKVKGTRGDMALKAFLDKLAKIPDAQMTSTNIKRALAALDGVADTPATKKPEAGV